MGGGGLRSPGCSSSEDSRGGEQRRRGGFAGTSSKDTLGFFIVKSLCLLLFLLYILIIIVIVVYYKRRNKLKIYQHSRSYWLGVKICKEMKEKYFLVYVCMYWISIWTMNWNELAIARRGMIQRKERNEAGFFILFWVYFLVHVCAVLAFGGRGAVV